MKKKIFMAMSIAAVAMLAVSCGKEHQCKCVATEGEDLGKLHILVVDQSLKCSDITEMAFEKKVVSEDGSQTLVRYDSYKVNCRDYGD